MPDDVAILRQILQRELETINAYEEMLEQIKDPALRLIIEHVTDEEREHVSEMYQLIMERDSAQAARSRRAGDWCCHKLRRDDVTGWSQFVTEC